MSTTSAYVAEDTKEFRLLLELCLWEWNEDGEDIDGMVEHFALKSVQPGICSDEDCMAVTTRIEPDQREGWCHGCGKNTVKSVGVLAGLC